MNDADVGNISRELLAELSGHGNLRRYAAGEVLITEGEVSDALYVLVAGQLKVYTSDAKGRELNYNILQPGEFFGEMGYIYGGEAPRQATADAMTDLLLAEFEPEKLHAMSGGAQLQLTRALVRNLVDRLVLANSRLTATQ